MVRDRLSFPLLPPCRLPWPIYLINWTYKKKDLALSPCFLACLFVNIRFALFHLMGRMQVVNIFLSLTFAR